MNNTIDIQTEQKQDKGFTLVELLIVIVILGILATVTVFAVRGITDQGRPAPALLTRRRSRPPSRRGTPRTAPPPTRPRPASLPTASSVRSRPPSMSAPVAP
jgi:prepilin-type N-terminal cleavage/methylation domain-containing protein